MKLIKILPLLWLATSASFAAEAPATPDKLIAYQQVLLKKGPNAATAATAEGQQLLRQHVEHLHLAYMDGQSQLGKLVVAGPILEESARRGIVVYRVATPEEAKERAESDPMVKAGRLQVELHPWQVPVGALPAAKTSQ